MSLLILKFDSIDSGFCRIYFKCQRRLYCLQPSNKPHLSLHVCTKDGEPDCVIDNPYILSHLPVTGIWANKEIEAMPWRDALKMLEGEG